MCFPRSVVKKILIISFLHNTSERLLLRFYRAPSSKTAFNAIIKSRQINWRIQKVKAYGLTYIYVLDFSNANLKVFTSITLNPRDRTRLIFKRNIKTKALGRFV